MISLETQAERDQPPPSPPGPLSSSSRNYRTSLIGSITRYLRQQSPLAGFATKSEARCPRGSFCDKRALESCHCRRTPTHGKQACVASSSQRVTRLTAKERIFAPDQTTQTGRLRASSQLTHRHDPNRSEPHRTQDISTHISKGERAPRLTILQGPASRPRQKDRARTTTTHS